MPELPGIPQGKAPDEAAIMREAADQGRLIEAGWLGLRAMWLDDDTPAIQVEEMRNAFFAGAQHMFAALNRIPEPGEGDDPRDLARMDKIHGELQAFFEDFKKRRLNAPTLQVAAAATGGTLAERVCHDQIDRALKDWAATKGGLSARDLALVLTFPLLRPITYGPIENAQATIDAFTGGLGVLAKKLEERRAAEERPV